MEHSDEWLARMVSPTMVLSWLRYNDRENYHAMIRVPVDEIDTSSTDPLLIPFARIFVQQAILGRNYSDFVRSIPPSAVSQWLQVHYPQDWSRLDANGCLQLILMGDDAPFVFSQFRCYFAAAMVYNAVARHDNIGQYFGYN